MWKYEYINSKGKNIRPSGVFGGHSSKFQNRSRRIWSDPGELPQAYKLYPSLFPWNADELGLAYVCAVIGYMSLSKEGEDTFELHNLAVLPEYRHNGLGKLLLDHAKEAVRTLGGKSIKIGIIEESTLLKNWYIANGFVHTGTKKFDHLPFTRGYLEWRAEQWWRQMSDVWKYWMICIRWANHLVFFWPFLAESNFRKK